MGNLQNGFDEPSLSSRNLIPKDASLLLRALSTDLAHIYTKYFQPSLPVVSSFESLLSDTALEMSEGRKICMNPGKIASIAPVAMSLVRDRICTFAVKYVAKSTTTNSALSIGVCRSESQGRIGEGFGVSLHSWYKFSNISLMAHTNFVRNFIVGVSLTFGTTLEV